VLDVAYWWRFSNLTASSNVRFACQNRTFPRWGFASNTKIRPFHATRLLNDLALQRSDGNGRQIELVHQILESRSFARHGQAQSRQREPDLRFVQASIALWESDRLPAIDLPVANAMNEKQHGRSTHRSRIQD
jgi:hypothetical protein